MQNKRGVILLSLTLILLILPSIIAEEIILKIGDTKDLRIQENLLKKHTKNLNITARFSSFTGVAVEVNQTQKEELENTQEIKIIEIKNYTITLDSSTPVINASNTNILLQNNINLTGKHQTVCIIDTGVNYNHPNLGGCFGNNDPTSNCKVIGGYDFINNDSDPMDDHGHGTHVAGIVASNDTTYQGVAPDSKIIAIKMLDAGGSGDTLGLISALEWCTNNATTFNISVISMSLGDNTFHTTYCQEDGTFQAIQAAISKNISVIVSSGNSNPYSSGISSPACTPGVMPVGAVYDNDVIILQRWPLWQILAPGIGIISTSWTLGFESKSGTSMSAPHVAGAVAIINQLTFTQQNKILDNNSIITALNQTNVFINLTSESNGYKPRLNILQTIYSLDVIAPNITLYSPSNNTVSTKKTQTFQANITDINIQNVTFKLYNSTHLVNTSTVITTGQTYNFQTTISNLSEIETYTWLIESFDANQKGTSQNYTMYIGGITVQTTTPANNSYTNKNSTNFTCTASTESFLNLENTTFTLYKNNILLYQENKNISGVTNATNFTYSLNQTTSYQWNCQATNNESQYASTNNYTVSFENTAPNLTIVSPTPTSETSALSNKTFYYNLSDDLENATCSLVLDNISFETTTITNYTITQNITHTFTPGTYNWQISCTDIVGNTNKTTVQSFTIIAPAITTSSGGGGGGGGSSSTNIKDITIEPEELIIGLSNTVKTKQIINFKLQNKESHSLTVNSIQNNQVSITIQSDPITLTLQENTTTKFNLTNPQYYNLQVTIGEITSTTANITVQEINERNPNYDWESLNDNKFTITKNERINEPEEEVKDSPKFSTQNILISIIAILITLIIGFIIYHILVIRKQTNTIKNSQIEKMIQRKQLNTIKAKRKYAKRKK
jgi:subtilisin family serine protease